jgi:hypothetical protein
MRRSVRVLIALLVLISMSGCATVLKGSNEKVSFTTDPGGAEIYINGQYMGKTPLQVNLRSKDVYSIEFRKQGYEPKMVQLNSRVGLGWVVLDVISGFVPVIIDAITGNWYRLEATDVRATL